MSNSYWEKIEQHIRKVVADREIGYLLHFTPIKNVPSILADGIVPRSKNPFGNHIDGAKYVSRLDNEDEAVSVSVSCYYPKLFYSKWQSTGFEPFAFLALHPRLLWEKHCLFYPEGIPKKSTSYLGGKRYGGYALQEMFDDFSPYPGAQSQRMQLQLPRSWPTFPDAEIQIMDIVEPEHVLAVVVEKTSQIGSVQNAIGAVGRTDLPVEVHPFRETLGHC